MHSGPYEPIMRDHLIRLLEAFRDVSGKSMTSICVKTCGGTGTFYHDLIAGRSAFAVRTYDRFISGISEAWPDDEPWPADIPRFPRSVVELQEKPRASARPAGEPAPATQ